MLGLFGQAFRPSGPRRAYCFGTGNQFRDKEPIRDREPFGTGNHFGTGNQGAAGAHFGTGNQVYDSVSAITCNQFRRPPRIERNYTTPSVGGNGNQKATGTKRQREPKGNGNQVLGQGNHTFSSAPTAFFLTVFPRLLKVGSGGHAEGDLLGSAPYVSNKRMTRAHKPKGTLPTGECGPSRL